MELLNEAEHTIDSSTMVDRLSGSSLILDDEEITQNISDYLSSDFFRTLADAQKAIVSKSLNVDESSLWAYGASDTDNTLFDLEIPIKRQAAREYDGLVISGLLGVQILGRKKKSKLTKEIDALASDIETDPLRKVILLGGVAIVADSLDSSWRQSISYISAVGKDGLAYETHIGGSMHGDFSSSREARFAEYIIDPLGRKLIFGPRLENVSAPAYHSSEPAILSAVLGYYVNKTGVDNRFDLRERIERRLEAAQYRAGGNFADFGDGDGKIERGRLRSYLREGVVTGTTLESLIIYPGDFSTRLNLKAGENGVDFFIGRHEGDEEYRFTIPDDEIEDYIVTLITSGFGRTSVGTLIDVLDVIVQ